jgi:hypothetical protein
MSVVSNPIGQVYSALWELLTDNDPFCILVPVGCRLKNVGGIGNPLKRAAQVADFPATYIEPVDGLTVKDWTNTEGHVKKRFRIKIATGNAQVDTLLELEWVIFACVAGWEAKMAPLEWKSKAGYVKHCGVYEQEETIRERELTRSETGWATVWDGEIWMEFPIPDIVAGPG